MRSLFHFPLPCTTTLAATVSYSNLPTAPEMSHRPHPAPMRRQRRSPVLLSAARTHWARLVRIATIACRRPHRIYPTACRHPHPPMSPPSRFRAHRPPITTIVRRRRLTRVALRRPHRAHRAPTSASPPHLSPRVAAAPGPWLARTAPYASLFRRMREKGPLPGNIRPKCMLFEIRMATSSPHASISGRNRAIQDTWRANLAAKGPFSRRGARNHAWREDVASAARPFRGSGMRSGRTGFAPCGAGLACLPHAPPAISPAFIAAVLHACASPPVSRPPRAAIRRAAHCGRDELSIGLFLPPSCCPRRCISLPARRTHPASRADPPRPGNKRNNANNSMRA